MKIYTAVGSRNTPPEVGAIMYDFAAVRASLGDRMATGGAPGADTFFLNGHYSVTSDNVDIYIPWDEFQGHYASKDKNVKIIHSKKGVIIAEKFYNQNNYGKKWDDLSYGGKQLMERNGHQVLGESLDRPVDFLICWTQGGREIGGTSQTIRIAKHHKVPVINLGNEKHLKNIQNYLIKAKASRKTKS